MKSITILTTLLTSQAGITGIATGSRCNLCHICPTFLGICCFIWLAIIIAAVIVDTLIVKRKCRNKDISDK